MTLDLQAANLRLRPLGADDLDRVAELHHQGLPDDFCSRLGPGFLRSIFYSHFMDQRGASGFVAVDGDDQVQGFVVGASGHRYYQRFFRRELVPVVRSTMGSLLRGPGQLGYFLDVARVMVQPGSFEPGERDAELLFIVVSDAFRGAAVGAGLVEALLAALSGQSYDRCVVKTLAMTPANVHFYRRQGFEIIAEAMGRVWLAHSLADQTGTQNP